MLHNGKVIVTSTGLPRPEIQLVLDLPVIADRVKAFVPQPETADEIATAIANLRATPLAKVDKIPVAEVWDFDAGTTGTKLRGYRPAVEGELPVLLYLHGGGWVFGDLDTHDAPCRAIANAARCIVVSVDYRLAPEHPYPGPLDDCYDVTAWVVANAATFGGDAARVAIAGASSGGNLAAAVALRAHLNGGPSLVAQALFYPVLDATTSLPSYTDNATGYNLSAAEMRFYWACYDPQGLGTSDPLLSPLQAEDLSGLPPAIIHTAEFDVLRDEGEAYGARLLDAGVPAVVRRYDGHIHGFASMGGLTADANHSLAEVGHWLEAIFHG